MKTIGTLGLRIFVVVLIGMFLCTSAYAANRRARFAPKLLETIEEKLSDKEERISNKLESIIQRSGRDQQTNNLRIASAIRAVKSRWARFFDNRSTVRDEIVKPVTIDMTVTSDIVVRSQEAKDYLGQYNIEGGSVVVDTSLADSDIYISGDLTINGDVDLSAYNITIDGSFNISSGTFNAPNTLTLSSDYNLTGGTFNPNNGTIQISSDIQTGGTFVPIPSEAPLEIPSLDGPGGENLIIVPSEEPLEIPSNDGPGGEKPIVATLTNIEVDGDLRLSSDVTWNMEGYAEVLGDLELSSANTQGYDVYVDGNLTINGSCDLNGASLYVTGDLVIGADAVIAGAGDIKIDGSFMVNGSIEFNPESTTVLGSTLNISTDASIEMNAQFDIINAQQSTNTASSTYTFTSEFAPSSSASFITTTGTFQIPVASE